MMAGTFLTALQSEVASFTDIVATADGDWIVKGFIDIYHRVYAVSADTKVISKVLELLLTPRLIAFGERLGYSVILPREQNFYPDLTFASSDGHLYAVDIKSTYRTGVDRSGGVIVNGMTLGAFTGYFRDRASAKNVAFPYGAYEAHLILGVIYSRAPEASNGTTVFQFLRDGEERTAGQAQQPTSSSALADVYDLREIVSVVRDFTFFIQPKYRIASSSPGSGNTKNIGSIKNMRRLLSGEGPFARLGESIFDDYWMYYLTADMARNADTERPYTDLASYVEYKRRGASISTEELRTVEELDTDSAEALDERQSPDSQEGDA